MLGVTLIYFRLSDVVRRVSSVFIFVWLLFSFLFFLRCFFLLQGDWSLPCSVAMNDAILAMS